MPKQFTYIVASLHGRSGKTLFARLLADYLILNKETPEIFDTDAIEKKLSICFPANSVVIDLDKVTNQMQLFDTLVSEATSPRIVDVTHRSFSKFFKLMAEIDYLAEARARDNEPVIFYVLDREPESYAQGLALRERFKDCNLILVENELNGHPDRETQNGGPYRTLIQHDLKFLLPALDPMFASVIEDPDLSLSGFMQDPPAGMPPGKMSLAYMSLEARSAIRGWLKEVNAELERLIATVKMRAAMAFRRTL
jgi:hypothetical protein